jgi:hypothetical protein
VNITHPNAQNITIQGPQNPTVHATSVTSITGSAFNWSVTFGGISSTAGIAVNNWVIANNPSGGVKTTLPLVCGFFKVTAVTANSITVKITYRGSSFPLPTLTQIDLTPITAIISAPLNTYGMISGAAGIGLVQYIGLVAQATPTLGCSGMVTSGRAAFIYVGVSDYNPVFDASTNLMAYGLVASTAVGALICTNCAVSNCQEGFVGATGGNVSMYSCIATHNNKWGCWFDSGGSCFFAYGTSFIAGNGDHGIMDSGGTVITVINTYPNRGHVWSYYNGGYGIYISSRAVCSITNFSTMRFWGNTTYDIAADVFGLFTGQSLVQDSKAVNIPIGTLSSTGALII